LNQRAGSETGAAAKAGRNSKGMRDSGQRIVAGVFASVTHLTAASTPKERGVRFCLGVQPSAAPTAGRARWSPSRPCLAVERPMPRLGAGRADALDRRRRGPASRRPVRNARMDPARGVGYPRHRPPAALVPCRHGRSGGLGWLRGIPRRPGKPALPSPCLHPPAGPARRARASRRVLARAQAKRRIRSRTSVCSRSR